MLCKCLKDSPIATPVNRPAHAHGGRPPIRTAASPAELAQLRADLAETAIRAKDEAKRAYDAGHSAGEAAARERLEAQTRALAEKLGAAVSEVAQTRAAILRGAECGAVQLAVEIAKRILRRELAADRSATEGLVKAALEKLAGREIYRVRVHPAQEPMLKACLEQAGRLQGVAVLADPTLTEGGVLFEAAGGAMDASLETQVSEIERSLADEIGSRA